MEKYYVFIGRSERTFFKCDSLQEAFDKTLQTYPLDNVKQLSEGENSIFFDAIYNDISSRCSVAHYSVINEEDLLWD